MYKMIGSLLFFTIAFEYAHYTKLVRRYNHFNNFRLKQTQSDEEQRKMTRAIIQKNPGLFERLSKFQHASHIVDEDALYNVLTIDNGIKPKNKLSVGCSEIYWRYHPHRFESFMICLRKLGELYMYFSGFKRSWYLTDDGYYSVYTYTSKANNNKRPIIFFPGFGLGAILYAHIAKQLNRTVYMIEVPNMGYATPLSERHATGETLYDVVNKCNLQRFDIFSHSLGTAHAAHLINTLFQKNDLHRVKNAIICDGFVNPIDALVSHIYPFVDFCDYNKMHKPTRNKSEFYMFIYFASQNPESNSWAKRFHNFYDGVLWRDYNGVNINYVYSEKDILYDTEYINRNSNCLLVKNTSHGASLFGKRSKDTIRQILIWLNIE
jgi:pimeloyl-ACP methyl ester carboxylesterase